MAIQKSERDESEGVHVPKWAITIIFLMLSNIIVVVYAAGKVSQRVENVETRLNGIDYRLNRMEDRVIEFLRR